ncbi:PLP-dependent transferase, partial [Aureobasidium melanogenum]
MSSMRTGVQARESLTWHLDGRHDRRRPWRGRTEAAVASTRRLALASLLRAPIGSVASGSTTSVLPARNNVHDRWLSSLGWIPRAQLGLKIFRYETLPIHLDPQDIDAQRRDSFNSPRCPSPTWYHSSNKFPNHPTAKSKSSSPLVHGITTASSTGDPLDCLLESSNESQGKYSGIGHSKFLALGFVPGRHSLKNSEDVKGAGPEGRGSDVLRFYLMDQAIRNRTGVARLKSRNPFRDREVRSRRNTDWIRP